MDFAKSSFPVPVSPTRKTVASVRAAALAFSKTVFMDIELLIILSKPYFVEIILDSFSTLFSSSYDFLNISSLLSSTSLSKGLVIKSLAPFLRASTAFVTVPCPVIIITFRSLSVCLSFSKSVIPSIIGITRSMSASLTSGLFLNSSIACSPEYAVTTDISFLSSSSFRVSTYSWSSSTISALKVLNVFHLLYTELNL